MHAFYLYLQQQRYNNTRLNKRSPFPLDLNKDKLYTIYFFVIFDVYEMNKNKQTLHVFGILMLVKHRM
jgi:hypothetical protein